MPFLYVRVSKAKHPNVEAGTSIYAKLVIETHSIRTKSVSDKDWDQKIVTSDVQATEKQLTKLPIGLLEVGIRGATNLLPVKTKNGTRGTAYAYVVAKYGPKWVLTRTILDRFNPRWHEQYTSDVYDQVSVIASTIGVFDNGRYKCDEAGKPGKDLRIGKLRIRLSTLDANG
ncbi:hypothetical protein IFM89_004362 [Coptis chinensis]|uniref:C2 domain-containing protein n=1 Tax=Coptis chinensis TaxID=261450 RepID=A0A835INW0_9MAGN|nr:hypothetical protein IFM89_004362 [Coptis chinensis]